MFRDPPDGLCLLVLASSDLHHEVAHFAGTYPGNVVATTCDLVRATGGPPHVTVVWHSASSPPRPTPGGVREWTKGSVIHAMAVDSMEALNRTAFHEAARTLHAPLIACEGSPGSALRLLLRAILEPLCEYGLIGISSDDFFGLFRKPAVGTLTHWSTQITADTSDPSGGVIEPPERAVAILSRTDLRGVWAPMRLGLNRGLIDIEHVARGIDNSITTEDYEVRVAANLVDSFPDSIEVALMTVHEPIG